MASFSFLKKSIRIFLSIFVEVIKNTVGIAAVFIVNKRI